MDKIKKENTLGGILIVGVLSIILMVVLSFSTITKMIIPFSFNQTWVTINDLSLDSYNLQWVKFVIFNFSTTIITIIFSIYLFIIFFKQSKYFPTILIIYFMYRVLLLTLIFYFQTIVKGPATPTLMFILSTAFRTLAIPAAWTPYILLSENSGETFIY